MKSDIELAKEAKMLHINEIAKKLNIDTEDLELYGKYKAKIPLTYIDEEKIKNSKLILVTAMTPTPAGEGKTTTSIGLAQGLNKIGKQATVVLREPSLGPVFGVKGGAAGGGMSQVVPMEDINLHFTGDLSAVEKANNLLAALIDNNIQNKKYGLNIDPRTVVWKRVMDMNDRSLRNIVLGLGGTANGIPRQSGFDITAASEVMAILCLAQDMEDLKEKLGNIFIGYTFDKQPIFARDLKAEGAMATLLKDALKPNLVQTMENTPAIIHGGPFANIAQGTNTLVATKTALSLSDYVVTEAGFASDLGAEKFLDIKARAGGISPDAVVIVATIRAIKYHGGVGLKELNTSNVEAVKKGLENIDKHIENVRHFGLTPVIAINHFVTDSDEEVAEVVKHCQAQGVKVAVNRGWEKGGEGAIELAEVMVEVTSEKTEPFKPLYELEMPMKEKIKAVAQKMYGADDVEFSATAQRILRQVDDLGLSNLPVCIAKTQNSLSDDPKLIGRPKGFTVTINSIDFAAGAGFIVPIAGSIMRMPGLPGVPSAESINVDNDGEITGLF
ncbi:MAG: formate--tetrahydrofolate ligase [Bacteroidales bacterium]|jgi:formate--tetrahydrofolate ligase|nr:formate--tetrahydrofolate ligase [Bacteroidales bacterium]